MGPSAPVAHFVRLQFSKFINRPIPVNKFKKNLFLLVQTRTLSLFFQKTNPEEASETVQAKRRQRKAWKMCKNKQLPHMTLEKPA